MNSYIFSLSSLDKRYIFSFFGTNSFFTSITWSHIFLVGILLLAFFSKTWIYLWNLRGTSHLASSFNFVAFTSLSQISHSSNTLFTFMIFFFLSLLFLFSFFLHSFSSCFFLFLSFAFTILNFLALVSTAFHTHQEISSFLLLLFSNQFLGYVKLTKVFLESHSTSTLLSHQSLSFPFVSCKIWICLSLLYALSVSSY